MTDQCERDLGRRLLASSLSWHDESAFLEHLDACAQCQSWLEDDAGDIGQWNEARRLLSKSGNETPARFGERTHSAHASVRAVLDMLGPTDDPARLGRIGSYEVMGVVGQGGMGVVFKAFDRTLDRVVAVKVIDPLLAKVGAARRRFAGEAKAMAAVFHENVVPIHAVSEHDGLPYFVMEYVPGCSLQRRIAANGPLDLVDVVRIAGQIARALAEAHRQGLIHRDIKPGNILLEQGVERVFVTDFGLARVIDDASMTQSGMLAGTPQFMSPEQVKGSSITPAADLFSLGSVMYAMCCGHPPFRAETVYGVMHRITEEQPRALRELNPGIPYWLDAFVARLLSKPADQRFASAAEVAELLAQELAFLQNPVTAEQPRRDWLPEDGLQTVWQTFRAGVTLTAAVVIVGISFWIFSGRSDEPSSQPTLGVSQDMDASSGKHATPVSTEVDTTRIAWDAPDPHALREQANRLESQWRAESENFDPWEQAVSTARDRVRAMLQDDREFGMD